MLAVGMFVLLVILPLIMYSISIGVRSVSGDGLSYRDIAFMYVMLANLVPSVLWTLTWIAMTLKWRLSREHHASVCIVFAIICFWVSNAMGSALAWAFRNDARACT